MTLLRRHWPVLPCLALAWLVAFLNNHKNALGLEPFARGISNQGNTAMLVLGIVGLLILAIRDKDWPEVWRVPTVMLTETLSFLAIKAVVWHGFHLFPRPSHGDGGFPSGHTAAHTALAFLLTERFPKLAVLWYGWAALMAWSRVEAGAHFAYQIAAGALLGFAVGALVKPPQMPRE